MRATLIAIGIGILGAVTWSVTAGEGPTGHGMTHVASGHGGLVGHMRHGESHTDRMGIFFPSVAFHQVVNQLSGEPGPAPAYVGSPAGVVSVAGVEHVIAGHMVSMAMRPLERVSARAERGDTVGPQPGDAGAADSDRNGPARAQPNPATAKPSVSRPPGAAGPGRRVFGLAGPGQQGPGRLVSPRW